MIRYRRLYEGDNPDLGDYAYSSIPQVKKYDIVRCAGYEWYVINIEDDIITLLAKNDDFGDFRFDRESNEYATSDIRKYLEYTILPKLQKANPIPTMPDNASSRDRVWLLSKSQARKLPEKVRRFPNWWWLTSPGRYDIGVAYVRHDGDISDSGWVTDSHLSEDLLAVRPAMRVHISDLD